MIVGYVPGGTIQDVRVVLRSDETIPNQFNTKRAVVYRENPENPKEWILVKAKDEVLPEDSPLLSEPAVKPTDVMELSQPVEVTEKTFEHVDIIRIDDEEEA